MLNRLLGGGLLVVLALPAVLFITPDPARAQAEEPAWGVQFFADGGYIFRTRNLGKNAVTLEEQRALQTLAEVEDSPFLGGGVEVLVPRHDLRVRGRVITTLGAEAQAVLGICKSGKVVDPGEGLCRINEVVDATIIDATVEVFFLREGPREGVHPVFSLGLGARSHDFNSDLSACNIYTGQEQEVCVRARQIFEKPTINPLLTFGVGLDANRGPWTGFVKVRGLTSSYGGGGGQADGERAVDLSLSGGISFQIF